MRRWTRARAREAAPSRPGTPGRAGRSSVPGKAHTPGQLHDRGSLEEHRGGNSTPNSSRTPTRCPPGRRSFPPPPCAAGTAPPPRSPPAPLHGGAHRHVRLLRRCELRRRQGLAVQLGVRASAAAGPAPRTHPVPCTPAGSGAGGLAPRSPPPGRPRTPQGARPPRQDHHVDGEGVWMVRRQPAPPAAGSVDEPMRRPAGLERGTDVPRVPPPAEKGRYRMVYAVLQPSGAPARCQVGLGSAPLKAGPPRGRGRCPGPDAGGAPGEEGFLSLMSDNVDDRGAWRA